jgi:serine/threonine-protein kinase RsbW
MTKAASGSNNDDIIELGLPVNPAYVSAARLTASSIANRMGFNIEDIEDIKAAVSEACTYLIKQNSQNRQSMFQIKFILKNKFLEIFISAKKDPSSKDYDEDGLGILMIEALMDDVDLTTPDDTSIQIIMHKKLR